jgi:hypothetical protein
VTDLYIPLDRNGVPIATDDVVTDISVMCRVALKSQRIGETIKIENAKFQAKKGAPLGDRRYAVNKVAAPASRPTPKRKIIIANRDIPSMMEMTAASWKGKS